MRIYKKIFFVLLTLSILSLFGCGQSGPLYLPPPSSTPNSTATP